MGGGQAATPGSSSGNWIALPRSKKAPAAAAGDAHENRTSRTRGDGNVRSGLAGRSPIRALSLSRATRTKRLDSALQLGDGAPRRAHAFPPRTSWGDPLGRPGTRGEAGGLKSGPKRVADSCDSAEAPLPAGLTSHV